MEKRLPRNGKEGLLYGVIIAGVTSILMATMNISISMGALSKASIVTSLKSWPAVFIIVMLIESLFVGKIAEKLVGIFTSPTDGFNANILFRTFFTAIGMSLTMTIVGTILGSGFSMEVLKHFPGAWPRNLGVALLLELIIVQPIARKVMVIIHESQDEKAALLNNETDLDEELSA